MLVAISFVRSDKKTLVLPKMPPERRKFVQEVNTRLCPNGDENLNPFLVGCSLQDGHPTRRPRTAQERPTDP